MPTNNIEIVKKIDETFKNNDIDGFLSYCADDVKWWIVGEKTVTGKDAIKEFMRSNTGSVPEFKTVRLFGDGDFVHSEGEMQMKDDGGKEVPYRYCDTYQFRDGKVVELVSYLISTAKESETSGTAAGKGA